MANAKYGDPIICFLGLEFPPSMQDEVQCCLSNYFPKSYAWRNEGKTGGLFYEEMEQVYNNVDGYCSNALYDSLWETGK